MPTFRNPANGYEETAGGVFGFIAVLLLGPLGLLGQGLIGQAIVLVLLDFVSLPFPQLILVWQFLAACTVASTVRQKYLRKGWHEA